MTTTATARSGEQFAHLGEIDLCYETFGDPEATPLLLIMGLSTQMVFWEDAFCAELAERGFFAIRFDNRDVGRSTILKHLGVPTLFQLARRDRSAARYTIEDMAADAAGLIEHLGLAAAHVVGVSMGGMIAQALAIEHPERVLSLTSIMSTTGNRRVGQPHPALLRSLLSSRPVDHDAYIASVIATYALIGSREYPPGVERMTSLAEASFQRGVHRSGSARQMIAIQSAKDRTPGLGGLTIPATVIHGTSDRLVRPTGGKATAAAIPGAKLVLVPGMAHDMPPALWPTIHDEIARVTAPR